MIEVYTHTYIDIELEYFYIVFFFFFIILTSFAVFVMFIIVMYLPFGAHVIFLVVSTAAAAAAEFVCARTHSLVLFASLFFLLYIIQLRFFRLLLLSLYITHMEIIDRRLSLCI